MKLQNDTFYEYKSHFNIYERYGNEIGNGYSRNSSIILYGICFFLLVVHYAGPGQPPAGAGHQLPADFHSYMTSP
jgi:hypothetical protein